MQLNEIIEDNTIEQISVKTRLTEENLAKIFARDCSGFTKVQVIGFISILEREYRVDLSDLKKECGSHFSSMTQDKPLAEQPEENPKTPAKKEKSTRGTAVSKKTKQSIKFVVAAVLVAGLLYAAWQTYTTNMQNSDGAQKPDSDVSILSSASDKAKSVSDGDGSTIVLQDQGQVDKESTKDTGADVTKPDDSFEIGSNSNNTPDTTKPDNQGDETSSDTSNGNDNTSIDDEMKALQESIANAQSEVNNTQQALTTEVPSVTGADTTENDNADDQSPDEESVTVATDEDRKAAEALAAEQEAAKIAAEKAAKAKAEAKAKEEAAKKAAQEKAAKEKAAKEKAAQEKAAREKAAREKAAREKAAKEKAAKEKAAKEKAAKNAKITLKPRANIWLGIVDLTNMKRKVLTGKDPVPFEGKDGKWLVATGHGRFDFRLGDKLVKFNDSKKHFLLIKNGKVKEIPHETFQQLNKSKVW